MLVFSESAQYKKLMENGFEKFPNKRDLTILCKFWLDEGTTFYELKDKMVEFCKKHNSKFNYAKSESLLLKVLKAVEEPTKEKEVDKKLNAHIQFYESETKMLKAIKDLKQQSVLFVMMALGKWLGTPYLYLNHNSVIKIKDVFNYAKVKLTKEKQGLLLNELFKADLIKVDLKPIMRTWLPFSFEGQITLEFNIDDDMLEYWKLYSYTLCEICRKPFVKLSNKQKYCKECAKIVKNEQNKNSASYKSKHNIRLGK